MFSKIFLSVIITLTLCILLAFGYLWVDDMLKKRKRNKRIDLTKLVVTKKKPSNKNLKLM